MFYYYIWNSDEEILAKRLKKQAETKFKNSWHTELEKIANEYENIIDGKYIRNI